jgi:hypothetical protein
MITGKKRHRNAPMHDRLSTYQSLWHSGEVPHLQHQRLKHLPDERNHQSTSGNEGFVQRLWKRGAPLKERPDPNFTCDRSV